MFNPSVVGDNSVFPAVPILNESEVFVVETPDYPCTRADVEATARADRDTTDVSAGLLASGNHRSNGVSGREAEVAFDASES